MLYGAQVNTMMPKLHSTNFPGMELIRPLYLVREADILSWKEENGLRFLQCACRFTERIEREKAGEEEDKSSKRQEMKELIARINAVLRRTEIPNDTSKRLSFDKLVVDLDSYELIVDGKKIDTPPKELELLYHLASTPNRVYTRNQLLDEVWGFDYFGDSRTVDVHIKRLREKVVGVSDQWELKTVWGVGYKFEMTGGKAAEKA